MKIAIPIWPDMKYPNYFAALTELGAVGERVADQVDPAQFDGLLLPGGDDVDPPSYHQDYHGAQDTDPALDRLQLQVIDRFFHAGKVIFGICRGHQILNVYFGGTLIQHLPQSDTHKWDEVTDADRVHNTIAHEGSWIAALYGTEFFTNSAHHQAVDALGRGLTVDQRALDGVIEAMHHECGRVYSVQWHPERMCFARRRSDTVDGSVVINYFLEQCKS